jgi:hypothetical protein
MATIFHGIPRDAETVAAVRRGCTERAFHTTCAETACRRARRCRGQWRAMEEGDAPVLPRCLAVRCDVLYDTLAVAETELTTLRLIVARARRLPDAELVAEWATFEADDAAPPWDG